MVDFSDRKSAGAWFEDQRPEVCIAMAARAALRVAGAITRDRDATTTRLALPVMRAILTSASASTWPDADVTGREKIADAAALATAANDAANDAAANDAAATATTRAAVAAAGTATSAALAATANGAVNGATSIAADDTHAVARTAATSFAADAAAVEAGTNPLGLFQRGAWDGAETPPGMTNSHAALLQFFDRDPETWGFWARWYRGMYEGRPLPWELQRRVALIDEEDWKQGAAHVAGVIRGIEERWLAEQLPQAGRIYFDESINRFAHEPIPVQNAPLVGQLLSRVEDALDDVLVNPSNGLSERSRETMVIRRLVSRYGNDPQRIEMDLVSVHTGLLRQIAQQDLPDSAAIVALQEAAEQGALGVRAAHPDVKANRDVLAQQAIAELTEAQRETIAEATPVLVEMSDEDLGRDFREDSQALLASRVPPEGPFRPLGPANRNPVHAIQAEEARYFGRVARIRMILRRTPELLDRIFESRSAKAAGLISSIIAIATLILSLLG